MKHLVTLTKSAEEQFKKLFLLRNSDKILLKINRRGCSGNSYQMDFVESSNPFDECITIPGGTLVIDHLSVMFIAGTTIDWIDNGLEQRFVFNNPNAINHCGCGESFYTER